LKISREFLKLLNQEGSDTFSVDCCRLYRRKRGAPWDFAMIAEEIPLIHQW
jgi:hypothetical protein